jgi:hypothetical protein
MGLNEQLPTLARLSADETALLQAYRVLPPGTKSDVYELALQLALNYLAKNKSKADVILLADPKRKFR